MAIKIIIKKSLEKLIADRYLLVLTSLLIILALFFTITIGLSIRPSELQLVSHYSAFGITHLYRDQWFYLLVFVVFGLIVAILHSVIAVKLLIIKGHTFAVIFTWFGIGVILLGWATALSVLNVWKPL